MQSCLMLKYVYFQVLTEFDLQWEKSDDKPAIAGLGFAGLIGIWASFGLVNVSVEVHGRLCAD